MAEHSAIPCRRGVSGGAPYRFRTAEFRVGGLPAMTAGPNGELYIVTAGRPTERPTDDSDIYLLRSLDGGQSHGIRCAGQPDGTDASQFFR
ncbi:MAG: hypothetical protein R2839_04700 [Thermomicrobiales bacterium]